MTNTAENLHALCARDGALLMKWYTGYLRAL